MDIEKPEDIDMIPDDMVCSVCNAEFLDFEDLQLHVLQVHLTDTRKRRFCNICTLIFPDIEAFALHLRNEHLSDLKCCKYCTRLFPDSNELQAHEKKHNAIDLYPKISCSHCKTVYINKIDLENHEYNEHRDSSDGLILRDCFSILSSLLNMNVRRFLEASTLNIPYMCAACDLTTSDISIYIQHLVDKKCRSLACDECCNVYSIKTRLFTHMLGHKTKPYKAVVVLLKKKCDKCQQLVKSTTFSSHLEECVGIKCTSCDMTFESLSLYNDHMTTHTRKIPLEVCIYCHRQMVGTKAMEKHIERTHKDEIHLYKYHCTDCNRLFKHPKLLFAHFFSKHKDLHPYTCKICDKTFRMRRGFTLHIKLDHKSVGYVEFDDNFHVFFTDKKSNKQSKSQDVLEEALITNNKNDKTDEGSELEPVNSNEQTSLLECQTEENDNNLSELPRQHNHNEVDTNCKLDRNEHKNEKRDVAEVVSKNESNETVCDIKEKPRKRKLTYNIRKKYRKRSKILNSENNGTESSSEDSDTPLLTIRKRLKLKSNNKKLFGTPWDKVLRDPKSKMKKLVCTKCNRYCYTYQNYHRHKAMHAKNLIKVCIKCDGKFNSVKELNEHIKLEHSTSKLTETLKKVLEKRKINDTIKLNTNTDGELVIEDSLEDKELTASEKFRMTVKKVPIEKTTTKVTIREVNRDMISVKKYLENFMPDNNEVKLSMVPHKLSLDNSGVVRRPLIKLTKFAPDPEITVPVKLKMPVKFTDDTKEKYDVSICLVQNPAPPAMNFDNFIDNHYDEPINFDDAYDYESVMPSKMDTIPDIAQEVYLTGFEEPCKVLHAISLQDLRIKTSDTVAIAHLSSQAPFYKISKVDTVHSKEEVPIEEEPPKDITLPNGTKLVSVNPLAHLLDNEAISQVLKARKPKYPYYKPKLRNIKETITKAMEKLERPKRVSKRKAR